MIARALRRSFGHVPNTARSPRPSVAPINPPPAEMASISIYNASKGGLIAWTKSAAVELASYGSVVAVGGLSTSMGGDAPPTPEQDEYAFNVTHRGVLPWGRSMFWMVRLPPRSEMDPESAAEEAARLAAEGAATDVDRQIPMHATRTIDYMVVLEGEITLILDEGEVTLQKFDTVVQRGTSHHWENRGSEPACLAFVLLDAKTLDSAG